MRYDESEIVVDRGLSNRNEIVMCSACSDPAMCALLAVTT